MGLGNRFCLECYPKTIGKIAWAGWLKCISFGTLRTLLGMIQSDSG